MQFTWLSYRNFKGSGMIGSKEKKFFAALQDLFIGVQTEGESGYTNLMNIKTNISKILKDILL